MSFADVLERTYFHRVSAWRSVSETGETAVCENVPCGLSRRAVTTAPVPADYAAVMPEAAYRLTIYTRPEVPFRLGDRLEVTDTRGRVYHGRASDSFCYDTHCVTVVEVTEVTGIEVSGDENSRETCPANGEESAQ